MERIDVTPSELRSSAKSIVDSAQLLLDEAEEIADAADTLRFLWQGDAQQEFESAQTAYRSKLERRAEALKAIAKNLRMTADAYAQADRDCSRALGGQ